MRLIDADSLIEEINKVYVVEEKEDLKWAKGLHYVKAIIMDMPTIETNASTILKEQEEKPLRCDKCSYHREDGWCGMHGRWVDEMDYCSLGAWKGR